MFNAEILPIFIASPGDVLEREFVRVVLAEWNARKSSQQNNVAFIPIAWETHVFPDLRTPGQVAIDQRLIDASYACIALFWMKYGGAMDGTSGTEHEIDRFRAVNKRVMAYFCKRKISVGDALHYGDDIRQVDDLRTRLQGQGIIGTYTGRPDLGTKLLGALDDVAREHIANRSPAGATAASSPTGTPTTPRTSPSAPPATTATTPATTTTTPADHPRTPT
ncbi:hypothetical protein ABZZ20_16295 [Streptomyces sp. NPDC006430]|uniref:hypothetical protein n=1 Tax=Streptomyces sp. NPDC006430 TaxID=3154299 RepID=UPI0033A925E1